MWYNFVCHPINAMLAAFCSKVYGVCSITRKDFFTRHIKRVRPVDWVTAGRFLVARTTSRDGGPKLANFSIYKNNRTENPYRGPDSGQISGTTHRP